MFLNVCVRERERVCVRERERKREEKRAREREKKRESFVCACKRAHVCALWGVFARVHMGVRVCACMNDSLKICIYTCGGVPKDEIGGGWAWLGR